MILVTGGYASGKNAYAEERILQSRASHFYYVETGKRELKPSIKETLLRWKRRQEKGFTSMEASLQVYECLGDMEADSNAVLIEDLATLVQNVMFHTKETLSIEEVVEEVVYDVESLSLAVDELVVVTSDVFRGDDTNYEEANAYVRALAAVNKALALRSSEVVEVVVGIPLRIA